MTVAQTSTPGAELLIEHAGYISTLTINRPEAFNALNATVLEALETAVASAQTNPSVRVIVLTGSGSKAFSAGADLKELATMGPDEAVATMRRGQEIFRSLEQSRVPIIAAVNGLALGGGFELVLSTTFSLVSTAAALGLPESSLGLIPGYGGTQRLARVIGKPAAAHVMLTGTRIDAERAHALGISPLPPVEPDQLLATAQGIAEKIAAQGPKAVKAILHAIDVGRDAPIDAGLSLETGLAALAIAGEESAEGIGAFLERRDPVFGESQEN